MTGCQFQLNVTVLVSSESFKIAIKYFSRQRDIIPISYCLDQQVCSKAINREAEKEAAWGVPNLKYLLMVNYMVCTCAFYEQLCCNPLFFFIYKKIQINISINISRDDGFGRAQVIILSKYSLFLLKYSHLE